MEVGSTNAQEVVFYSIRPAPPQGEVPPLQGPLLNIDEADDAEGGSSPQNSHVVALVDSVEAGVVRGWACSLVDTGGEPLKVSVYVDNVLAAEALAIAPVTLPTVALRSCHLEPRENHAYAVGFSARLPPLPHGRHVLRAFVHRHDTQGLQEVYHSPLTFIESSIEPDAKEILRRKDAIIVRRNAELAALFDDVKTQLPWRKAEAAAARQAAGDAAKDGKQRLLAVLLVHSVRGTSSTCSSCPSLQAYLSKRKRS